MYNHCESMFNGCIYSENAFPKLGHPQGTPEKQI